MINKKLNKILLVGPHPKRIGGVSKAVNNHLNNFSTRNFEIQYSQTGRNLEGKGTNNRFVRNVVQVKNFLLKFRTGIHLVHLHITSFSSFWRFCIFIFISKIHNVKSIVHVHGGSFDKFFFKSGKIGKYLIKEFLNANAKVIVLSEYWKSFFLRLVEAPKLAVVPNSVSIKKVVKNDFYNTDDTKAKLDFNIFFLGALSKQKGLEELIIASKKINQVNDKIIFNIAGFVVDKEISLFKKIYNLSQKKNSNINFQLNVVGDKKEELFYKSDLFILPSYSEGLPFVILEALSYGLPVITTAVGGIPEVIVEGKNGLFVEIGSADDLVDKIFQLYHNPEIIKKMEIENFNKIKEMYEHEIIFDKIQKIYEDLL